MEIRHYMQKDEQAVVELWNRTCVVDAIDVRKFRRQAILDENFESALSWVAEDNGIIVGFIYGTKRKFPYLERGLEPDRGWINVLFVEHSYWRQGIGSKLLMLCENALKERGCKWLTLGAYSPNYFFPGVDSQNYPGAIRFFEKHGYIAQDAHYSMGKDLHGYQIPEETLQKKKDAVEALAVAEGGSMRFAFKKTGFAFRGIDQLIPMAFARNQVKAFFLRQLPHLFHMVHNGPA